MTHGLRVDIITAVKPKNMLFWQTFYKCEQEYCCFVRLTITVFVIDNSQQQTLLKKYEN